MGGDNRAAPHHPQLDSEPENDRRRNPLRDLQQLTPWHLRRRIAILETQFGQRLGAAEHRLDTLESAVRTVQQELAELRENRVSELERRTDTSEQAVQRVSEEASRLRDRVIPAAVARTDALLERLAEELEELSSLVERSLRGEPLPVVPAGPSSADEELAAALAEIQPGLLESFRGSEVEITHRLDRYLSDLQQSSPVLDLGCGRGELLLMLRDAGIEASGIESDGALAEAARRRGLRILEGDVLEALRSQPEASRGAVTAIHLLEHLEPAVLAAVLAECRRVLRPGGVLIAECPNPHSLRVGAALFWQDPTHVRPLLPETLELFLKSAGFQLLRRELMHPFPTEQLLAVERTAADPAPAADLSGVEDRIQRLSVRLDELINGPRDFAVWAERPSSG